MPSAAQKTQRIKFKQAHLFAKNINDNPASKAAFALKKYLRVKVCTGGR